MVLANFLRIIEHVQVHLLTWSQRASPGFNLKDFLVKDLLLKRLFLAWGTWVSPGLHLDLRVVGHLEVPIGLNSSYIFERKCDPAWL